MTSDPIVAFYGAAEQLRNDLRNARQALAAAEAHHKRGAYGQVGALMRQLAALDDTATSLQVGGVTIVEAAQLTGLSRPMLYKLRDRPVDGPGLEGLTNAELATRLLHNPTEQVRSELHARFPYLGGWWGAMAHLAALDHAPRDGDDVYAPAREEHIGARDALREKYRTAIGSIITADPAAKE